jgi:hypothetical protein
MAYRCKREWVDTLSYLVKKTSVDSFIYNLDRFFRFFPVEACALIGKPFLQYRQKDGLE